MTYIQGRSKYRPRSRPRIVGRMDSDIPMVGKFSCAVHQVAFYGDKASQAECPVCVRDQVIDELQDQKRQLVEELQFSLRSTERLSVQVNELDAMRKALEVINSADLTFVKSILYRWQKDETCLTLVASQDAEGRWQFIARVKKTGNNRVGEMHLCSSIGGVALASSYEQAVKVTGVQNATRMLLRAVSQHLANVEAS